VSWLFYSLHSPFVQKLQVIGKGVSYLLVDDIAIAKTA